MRKKLIIGMIIALVFTLPLAAVAANDPPLVVISEVNWAGSSASNADEWLELQNLEGETMDLSGWSIEGAGASGAVIVLPLGASIASGGTYLVSNYDVAHSTLSAEPNFTTTAVSLSNSALKVALKNAAGTTVDTVGDGKLPAAGSSTAPFASMVRTESGWKSASTKLQMDAEANQLGTPGIGDLAVMAPDVVVEPAVELAPAVDPPPVALAEGDEESTTSTDALESEVATPEQPTSEAPAVITDDEISSIAEVVADAVMGESVVEADPSTEEVELVEIKEIETDPPTITPVAATASYAAGDLIINEVVSNPTSGNEWVEVYNPYQNVIPLDGWKLTEAGGTSVALSGLIGEESFVVVEFSNRLNNSGDTVMLSDPSGAIVDDLQFGEGSRLEAPEKGTSLARNADEEFVITTTPTRGDVNQINEPEVVEKTTSAETTKIEAATNSAATQNCQATETLRIVKLLPDPSGDEETDELIVLENSGEETVCLDGWTIGDASKTYNLVGALGAHLRLELPRTATKIALNNTSAEEVLLTNPAGEIINQVTYEKAIEDTFYTFLDGQWAWQTVSAGDEPEDVQCPDVESGADQSAEGADGGASGVKAAKSTKKATGTKTVEGVVIATPGTFGEQIMYVDGLQLYQYSGDFPALEVGDVVAVEGVPSTSHGEARLKVTSADKVTIVGTESVEAAPVELAEVAQNVGRLVQVEGVVTRRSGERMTLEANGEALTVIAKDGADLSFTSLVLGTPLSVTGVVSSYDGSPRLLPRGSEDVETLEATTTDDTDETAPAGETPVAGIGLAGITTTAVGARAWWWKRKKKLI